MRNPRKSTTSQRFHDKRRYTIFRPGVDAKKAIQRAYYHVTERGLSEVVDADLSDYFTTIPHGAFSGLSACCPGSYRPRRPS